MARAKAKKVRLLYERRVNLYSLLLALPGSLVSGIFIWLQPWTLDSKLILCFVELFACWLLAMALQEQVTRPLQTLANVVAALREEDYSFRARGAAADDALGELSIEVNGLADLLPTVASAPSKRPRFCAGWLKKSKSRYLPLTGIRRCAW